MKRTLGMCLGLMSLGVAWIVRPASDPDRKVPATQELAAARPPASRWLAVTPTPTAAWSIANGADPPGPIELTGPMPPPLSRAPVPPPPSAAADAQVPRDRDPHEVVEHEVYPPGHPLWRIPPERSRQMQLDNEREARARQPDSFSQQRRTP